MIVRYKTNAQGVYFGIWGNEHSPMSCTTGATPLLYMTFSSVAFPYIPHRISIYRRETPIGLNVFVKNSSRAKTYIVKLTYDYVAKNVKFSSLSE